MYDVLVGIASAVALVLSVWTFTTDRWAKRKASLTARHEQYRPVTSDRREALVAEFERIVVVNHGPASATDIEIRVSGPKGEEIAFHAARTSVDQLHPGEQYHLLVTSAFGDPYPHHATLTWKDDRRKRHSVDVSLSVQQVI